jgi:transposase-like protein
VERRAHSLSFKLKVVAQALRRNAVVADVAQKHGIHSNLPRQWKAQSNLLSRRAKPGR